MKIPNKRELKGIPYNQSSDIDSKEFMNLYKNCVEKKEEFQKESFRKNIKNNNDN